MFRIQNTKNLNLLTIPMPSTETITILALFKSGSRNEDPKRAGIAHFTEHIVFDGTKKWPTSTKIASEIDSVGGVFNAYTSKESTAFFVKLCAEDFKIGLDIISDMIHNPLLKNTEIKKEKKIISEEIKMLKDTPMRYVALVFEETLYPNSNLGRSIAGDEKTILSITQDDLKKYMRNYSHDNSVLVLAGNPKYLELAKRRISDYFKFENLPTIIDKKININQEKPQIKIINKKTEQSHVMLGFRTVDTNNEQKYSLGILSKLLGGYMSSRLFDLIRSKHALAYYVKAGADHLSDTGEFHIQAGVAHKNSQKVVDLIIGEIEKIKKELVPDTELQKTKNHLKGAMIIDFENPMELAEFFGYQSLFSRKILTPKQILDKIDKVTSSDIQKVANEFFKPELLNIAMIGKGKIRI